MSNIITQEIYDLCQKTGACEPAFLEYISTYKKTLKELVEYNKSWANFGAMHIDLPNDYKDELYELIGIKCTFNKKGRLHSFNNQPAIIYASGSKFWYKNGEMHRVGDEPAVIYARGAKFWYKNGNMGVNFKI